MTTWLVIPQGQDGKIKIADIRNANDVPITDFTGFGVRAQIRDRPQSTVILHEWSLTAGTITFSGSTMYLTLDGATSSTWEWLHGRFDVELTSPTGDVAFVGDSHVTIKRRTTR